MVKLVIVQQSKKNVLCYYGGGRRWQCWKYVLIILPFVEED